MGLLQDPVQALDQVEWYLDHPELEKFPGAFELAGGALCRQTLEQALFLLCFFSGMPRTKFLRADRTLQVAGRLVRALGERDSDSGRVYFELARCRGPRIGKLARWPRSLARWQRLLNEPAHFSTRNRDMDEATLRGFVRFARTLFDGDDKYALVAAINEIYSGGIYTAVLSSDDRNMPGLYRRIVVGPSAIQLDANGQLSFKTPAFPLRIISATDVPRGPWPRGAAVIVQHTVGMSIGGQLVTRRGDPIDLTSLATTIASFARNPGQRRYIRAHFRKLGLRIEFNEVPRPDDA